MKPISPFLFDRSRRTALKTLTLGGSTTAILLPSVWMKPIVDAVVLPAHAQTSERDPIDDDPSGPPDPPMDSDGDGVADNIDACPAQGDQGFGVDANGCPNPPPPDSDGDGVPDNIDACPAQGDQGFGIDATGCPNPDPNL